MSRVSKSAKIRSFSRAFVMVALLATSLELRGAEKITTTFSENLGTYVATSSSKDCPYVKASLRMTREGLELELTDKHGVTLDKPFKGQSESIQRERFNLLMGAKSWVKWNLTSNHASLDSGIRIGVLVFGDWLGQKRTLKITGPGRLTFTQLDRQISGDHEHRGFFRSNPYAPQPVVKKMSCDFELKKEIQSRDHAVCKTKSSNPSETITRLDSSMNAIGKFSPKKTKEMRGVGLFTVP